MLRNYATVLEIPIASDYKDKVPSYLCFGYHETNKFLFLNKGCASIIRFWSNGLKWSYDNSRWFSV